MAGDFTGSGSDTPGVFYCRDGTWYFAGVNAVYELGTAAGADGSPATGDFDGDGIEDVGLWYRVRYETIWQLWLSTQGAVEVRASEGRPRP